MSIPEFSLSASSARRNCSEHLGRSSARGKLVEAGGIRRSFLPLSRGERRPRTPPLAPPTLC